MTCNYLITEKKRKRREGMTIVLIVIISFLWSAICIYAGAIIGKVAP